MRDTALEETLQDIGLTLLCMAMRERLRAGIHPDAVTRWVDGEMAKASRRVDAIERGERFFCPRSPLTPRWCRGQ